jgi:hypothetical protein
MVTSKTTARSKEIRFENLIIISATSNKFPQEQELRSANGKKLQLQALHLPLLRTS